MKGQEWFTEYCQSNHKSLAGGSSKRAAPVARKPTRRYFTPLSTQRRKVLPTLLDEPFTGIDPVTIHSIQDIIAELRSSGISILLTDHRERETLTITSRNYIISAGKVLVSGDAETVLSDPLAKERYFGKRFDGESIISGKSEFQGDAEQRPAA